MDNYNDSNNQNEPTNTNQNGSYNTYYQQPMGYMPPNQGQGLGVAALICGILSILSLCCCPPICIVFSILGIVFGIIKTRQGGSGKEMAIAGIVTGIIGAVLVVVIIVIYTRAIILNPGYMNEMYQIIEEIA